MHAHEVGDLGAGLLEDLADGLRGVTGEGLVNEAVVLEERVQATVIFSRVARSLSSTSAGTESRSR